MADTTVKAPTADVEAGEETEAVATEAAAPAPKAKKTVQEQIDAAMAKAESMPEFHVMFAAWMEEHGHKVDVDTVLATQSLYGLFRQDPEFQAKREQKRLEGKTKAAKAIKPASEMTPEELQDEAKKAAARQAAAVAAQAAAEQRAAEVQAEIARLGLQTTAPEADEASEPVVDEDNPF
jgi:hypothetical protein